MSNKIKILFFISIIKSFIIVYFFCKIYFAKILIAEYNEVLDPLIVQLSLFAEQQEVLVDNSPLFVAPVIIFSFILIFLFTNF